MNQPNLLMPSSFALFRGVLRNRFGAVSLTISFANLISGVIVTILFRLNIDYPFSKRQRFLFGSLPYALLHLTAILPALVYIIQTMNLMDEEHLSKENLAVFVGREWLFHSGSVYCKLLK
jgi:ABC-type glycerol-3-phosphate transport system permease component